MPQARSAACAFQRMALGQADGSGRRRPEPIPGSEFVLDCQVVVAAIGMEPDDTPYAKVTGIDRGHRIKIDPITLQDHLRLGCRRRATSATDITRAIGHGRRAAYIIDNSIDVRRFEVPPLRRSAGRGRP